MKKKLSFTIIFLMFISVNLQAQSPDCVSNVQADEILDSVKQMGEVIDDVGYVLGGVGVAVAALPGAQIEGGILGAGGLIVTGLGKALSGGADLFKDHQYGTPKGTLMPWDTINAGKPYLFSGGDGDKILIYSQEGTGKLRFELAEDMTWWKGLVIFQKEDTNKWQEIICLQDDRKVQTITKINPELGKDHYIVLSKAKTLGVHTNMYELTSWDKTRTDRDYFFKWVTD